jgi:hypothetical protein
MRALGPAFSMAAFYLNRQLLAPYNNILDRIEAPEATDLTSFVPRPRELAPSDYSPGAADALVPWLRNAGVAYVLSLDPLDSPSLRLEAEVPAVAGTLIRTYSVRDPAPSSYLACRAVAVATREEALARPYRPGFDLSRDVALEAAGQADCASGRSILESRGSGEERFLAEADGQGFLVVRASFARGWRALVDGRPAQVLRANGKHRAVSIPPGRHEVTLRYHPPGLGLGLVVSGLAVIATVALAARNRVGFVSRSARG